MTGTAADATSASRGLTHNGAVLLACRLVVGALMVYMSLEKIQDPVAFLKVVKQYQIVPLEWHVLLNSIAVVVPWIELLGGAALILGLGLRGVSAVMVVMLVCFTAAVSHRTWTIMQTAGTPFLEVRFDCGCGAGPQIIWVKLLENFGLILLSAGIFVSRSRAWCLSALFFGSPREQVSVNHKPAGQPTAGSRS